MKEKHKSHENEAKQTVHIARSNQKIDKRDNYIRTENV